MNAGARVLAALASASLIAACGGDGGDAPTAGASRTVKVVMRDIAFSPTALTVARGEKVRFVFSNEGKVAHDAYVGDRAAQDKHEREMRDGDGGHGGHSEGSEAITVKPGKAGSLVYSFDDAGAVEIGCHQPGHYSAGMKIAVTIT